VVACNVASHRARYTGILNIETSAPTHRLHLPFNRQWPDLLTAPAGSNALVRLYRERRWEFADADRPTAKRCAFFPARPRLIAIPALAGE